MTPNEPPRMARLLTTILLICEATSTIPLNPLLYASATETRISKRQRRHLRRLNPQPRFEDNRVFQNSEKSRRYLQSNTCKWDYSLRSSCQEYSPILGDDCDFDASILGYSYCRTVAQAKCDEDVSISRTCSRDCKQFHRDCCCGVEERTPSSRPATSEPTITVATAAPSLEPTSEAPTLEPTGAPTLELTGDPTLEPTGVPTSFGTTMFPTGGNTHTSFFNPVFLPTTREPVAEEPSTMDSPEPSSFEPTSSTMYPTMAGSHVSLFKHVTDVPEETAIPSLDHLSTSVPSVFHTSLPSTVPSSSPTNLVTYTASTSFPTSTVESNFEDVTSGQTYVPSVSQTSGPSVSHTPLPSTVPSSSPTILVTETSSTSFPTSTSTVESNFEDVTFGLNSEHVTESPTSLPTKGKQPSLSSDPPQSSILIEPPRPSTSTTDSPSANASPSVNPTVTTTLAVQTETLFHVEFEFDDCAVLATDSTLVWQNVTSTMILKIIQEHYTEINNDIAIISVNVKLVRQNPPHSSAELIMESRMNDGTNVSLYAGYYETEESIDNSISERTGTVEYAAEVASNTEIRRMLKQKLIIVCEITVEFRTTMEIKNEFSRIIDEGFDTKDKRDNYIEVLQNTDDKSFVSINYLLFTISSAGGTMVNTKDVTVPIDFTKSSTHSWKPMLLTICACLVFAISFTAGYCCSYKPRKRNSTVQLQPVAVVRQDIEKHAVSRRMRKFFVEVDQSRDDVSTLGDGAGFYSNIPQKTSVGDPTVTSNTVFENFDYAAMKMRERLNTADTVNSDKYHEESSIVYNDDGVSKDVDTIGIKSKDRERHQRCIETASVITPDRSIVSRSLIIPCEDFAFSCNDSFENQYEQASPGDNVIIRLPPGPLGVVLDDVDGAVVICGIKRTSKLFGQVHVGDALISIDKVDVASMSACKVSELILSKSTNPLRILCFSQGQ